jgi:hypothetical protein
MKIAQISDLWSQISCLPSETECLTLVTTLTHIFAVIWSLIYISFVEIMRKIMELLYIFLFADFPVSLSLSPPHCASWRWGWRNGLQTWRVAASILNKQSGQKANCGPAALCLGELLTNSQLKNLECYQLLHNGWYGLLWIRIFRFNKIRGIPRTPEGLLAS